jgi:hypothetical protein
MAIDPGLCAEFMLRVDLNKHFGKKTDCLQSSPSFSSSGTA